MKETQVSAAKYRGMILGPKYWQGFYWENDESHLTDSFSSYPCLVSSRIGGCLKSPGNLCFFGLQTIVSQFLYLKINPSTYLSRFLGSNQVPLQQGDAVFFLGRTRPHVWARKMMLFPYNLHVAFTAYGVGLQYIERAYTDACDLNILGQYLEKGFDRDLIRVFFQSED